MMMMDSGSISSVSINFIRSRRGAGARGSRIHVGGVLGDSFSGVARYLLTYFALSNEAITPLQEIYM